ncbi:MAG: hypothetical protein RL641_678 [Candidatus Parcubacteria bacterium]|jgi:hypothetical protein
MIITYFGKRFLKLQYGDTVIGVNAPTKESPWSKKTSTFGADISISTSSDPDTAGAGTLSYGDREPFIVDGPGSYEAKGIFISGGFMAEVNGRRENAFSLTLEGMSIAVLGQTDTLQLPNETKEILMHPDILILPLDGTMLPRDSYKLAMSLEPMIIVPVDYSDDVLKQFIKEAGSDKPEVMDKLTLKRKDLEGKDGTIMLISPQAK